MVTTSDEPRFYHLRYWKPATTPKHITPCERTDPDQNEIRIETHSRAGRVEESYHRADHESLDHFHYRIEAIERLMQAAFDQGQRHRAGLIKEALEFR